MVNRAFRSLAVVVFGGITGCPWIAQAVPVAKVMLQSTNQRSLSDLLYSRWGIGSKDSPYRLYGEDGWVNINLKLQNNEPSGQFVFIPPPVVRPEDQAILGSYSENFQFEPAPKVVKQAEPPAPPAAPMPAETPDPPKPRKSSVRGKTVQQPPSNLWEVSGAVVVAQSTTETQGSSAEPLDKQEVSVEGIGLYILGPWAGFFSVGMGPAVSLASKSSKQTQTISDGFDAGEKQIESKQSLYSVGVRSHFYLREFGQLRSVPFIGVGYHYTTGSQTETGSSTVDLSGFGYVAILAVHIPLLDAVSLTPEVRYEVTDLEQDAEGDTIKETTSGYKLGLGLSVFL